MKRTLVVALVALAGACSGGTAANNANNANNGGGGADTGSNNAPLADGGLLPDGGTAGDMGPTGPPPETSGNYLNQDMLFVCGDELPFTRSRIRRIGRSEWTRNTGNSEGSNANKNPFDPMAVHQYSSYSDGETIDESVLDIYLDTVGSGTYGWATRDRYRAGALASNVEEPSIACMFDESARPDEACISTYTAYVLERGVLFRPPTAAEHEALVAFAKAGLDDETANQTSRQHTLDLVVSAAWMSSGALFRTELGDGSPDAEGRERLSDWELANAIAYALDGRAAAAPGVYARFGLEWSSDFAGHLAMLRESALDGSIQDPAKIDAAVTAYFGGLDPDRVDLNLDVRDERRIERRGEYWVAFGIRDFFREWLGYMDLVTAFKDDPSATSFFGTDVNGDYGNLISGYYGYEPRLVEQMDDLIARIVAEDTDVFRTLLTTRRYYTPATAEFEGSNIANSTLNTNAIYNMTQRTEATREARWATLPEDERAGVLTHPAFLAAHALAFENDPNAVHRGKWVRENLLCGVVPDVPITVNAAFDPDTRDQSARQRMTEQVDSRPECAPCHAAMNPLGYPFEIYNHAGFLREQDHGGPPDGSSTLANMPDPALNGPIRDAVDLSEKLAESDYTKRCFIRQTFRYFVGREEVQRDACTLTEMESAYDDSDGSFRAMLSALFQSDSFIYRVDED